MTQEQLERQWLLATLKRPVYTLEDRVCDIIAAIASGGIAPKSEADTATAELAP
jgi:hypothetical protein